MSNPGRLSYVLDAGAVLALLGRERGWEHVAQALDHAVMSSVNFCEVLSKMAERGADAQTLKSDLLEQLSVLPFGTETALLAAQLRPQTRALGLSLGDRVCLALALERGAVALTTDRAWAGLEAPHRIELLR